MHNGRSPKGLWVAKAIAGGGLFDCCRSTTRSFYMISLKELMKHEYIKQYGRLIVVVLVATVGGVSALIYDHQHPVYSACSPGSEAKCGYVPATKQAESDNSQSTVEPSTPQAVTTPTPKVVTPTPSTDNSAECNSILASGKAGLNSLNSQIVQQLQIEKTIIGNNSIDNEILSHGGSLDQIIGQSQITETFNQADAQANDLINQINPTRQQYVNQLESLQCWSQALTMLNYNPSTQ